MMNELVMMVSDRLIDLDSTDPRYCTLGRFIKGISDTSIRNFSDTAGFGTLEVTVINLHAQNKAFPNINIHVGSTPLNNTIFFGLLVHLNTSTLALSVIVGSRFTLFKSNLSGAAVMHVSISSWNIFGYSNK